MSWVKNPIFKIIKIKFHSTGVHYLNKIFVQKRQLLLFISHITNYNN